MKTTDIHSHMFNLKYLPVAGILRRYSNEKIPLPIARGVERYLVRKTESSFEKENGLIAGIKKIFSKIGSIFKKSKPVEKIQELLMDRNFKLFSWDKKSIVKNFSKQLELDDLMDPVISDALNHFQEMTSVSTLNKIHFANAAASGKNPEQLLVSGNKLFDEMLQWVFDELDRALGLVDKGLNFARWFAFMLNNEEDIYTRISGNDAQGVSRFVHLMMDVDYFFTETDGTTHHSHFDFVKEQIPNMEKLDKKHPGVLNGFVAFNPSRPDCLDIVKSAISKGFKGVKFYPPLGYRASGDDNLLFRQRIDELFEYCCRPENDIPIFTHCNNQGFEANPKTHSGYNSNPVYWAEALEKFPNLRLCLAHGGGVEGWFCFNRDTDYIKAADIKAADIKNDSDLQTNWNNSYAAMVFKLCVEKKNVYCDAAYLDDLLKPDGTFDPTPKDNFQKRLIKLFASEPVFAEKIIYGSDWHMLFQEGKNEAYYKTYLKFYSDTVFDLHRDNFFEKNANRYLKF